jgi:restriction system protein
MDIPKYHETFIPILEILSDGKIIHYNDLRKRVRDKYYSDLPNELLNKKTTTGANVLIDRIGWGKSYLKQGKFLFYPERAMVQITEKGKAVLKNEKFTLKELKKDSDYIAYQEAKKAAKESKGEELENENASPQDLIDSGFSAIETQVKSDLLERLKDIDPYYFEKVILILLQKMGYGDFVETSKSNDGGIDGIINEDRLGLDVIYIQAKRWEGTVGRPEIQKFAGALQGQRARKGVFITTSSFTKEAKGYVSNIEVKIILIDGDLLSTLMVDHNVGVSTVGQYKVKKLDSDYFDE